jgi:hypothetical protein
MKRAKLFAWALAVASMLVPAAVAVGGGETGGTGGTTGPSNEPLLHVWMVNLQPDQSTAAAGKFAFKDCFLFEENNQFTAEAFGALGFGQAEYAVAEVAGATLGFSTTIANGEQGTLVWNGVLRNGQLIGTLVWTKPDNTVGTYNFTAEMMD